MALDTQVVARVFIETFRRMNPRVSLVIMGFSFKVVILFYIVFCGISPVLSHSTKWASQSPTLQVEWRMLMLCEQSGFINEALDFLVSLEHQVAPKNASLPISFDLSLTGLYGDCSGLSQSMRKCHAETLHRLRSIDQGQGKYEYGSNTESLAGTQHNSCMLNYIEEEGQYAYVCDRSEDDKPEQYQPRKVYLGRKRITVEHGHVCTARKRGKLNVTEFEKNYGARPEIMVSRVMTESSEVSAKETKCIVDNGADELWVPTKWHAGIYRRATADFLDPGRVIVMPEIVDVEYFSRGLGSIAPRATATPFVFLSVFKWEWRKGWDVLLLAYWKAFQTPKSNVLLRIKTFRPQLGLLKGLHIESSSGTIDEEIDAFARGLMGVPRSKLPKVEVISEFYTREQVRDLYANADVFVLPTRGEGWGLPIVEAMAMELPVIVTNHSGPTEYLTNENSFPLRIDGIEGGYAMPSVKGLIEHMKTCIELPEIARAKGRKAAADMEAKYSSDVLGAAMTERFLFLSRSLG